MTTTQTDQPAAAPKEHWRTMHDSNSEDFAASDLMTLLQQTGGGTDLHVRIESAGHGTITDFDTNKVRRKVTYRFVGIDKPYKSCVTNNNATSSVLGSPYPIDWTGGVITLYVGKAERGRRKGDPEGTPKKVIVDAVRFRPVKPPVNARIYGVTADAAPAFDLDGWIAAFADAASREDFASLREKLNQAKRPKEAREPLAKAVEAARVRLFDGEAAK